MSVVGLLEAARCRLAGAPREPLGLVVRPRRILGFVRPPRIVHHGDVWHLGVLLLGDDAVFEIGEILRAREEARRGYTAESQRRRSQLMAEAFRGGFAEGQVFHVGWRELDAAAVDRGGESGPLDVAGGIPRVRWASGGDHMPLLDYLDQHIDLLLHPPQGAT